MASSTEAPTLDLDNRDQAGFCAFFRSMPQKSENTVRLFERGQGDFFSVHGDDAVYVAQKVFKTSSVIKYLGGDSNNGIPSCTLTRLAAETFLREALLVQQLRVEIWGSESKHKWRIVQQASPGNLQDVEGLLFANSDITSSPVVLAVKLSTSNDHKVVGAAFADATQRELGVCEFVDNELYSNFESLLIQLGIKECVVQADDGGKDYELLKLRGVVEKCNVVITEQKKGTFAAKNIEQDLNRLVGVEGSVATLPEFDMKNAMSAMSCLIKYLGLLDGTTDYGQFVLRRHTLTDYMRLDASALSALNLLPTARDVGNKTMSLFGLLNKCKTAQGTRLLGQWLKQPLMNVGEIERRQAIVDVFVVDTEFRQSLQESHLKSLPDLHRLAKKFQRGVATLQDVVRVYQVAVRLPSLVAVLDSFSGTGEKREVLDGTYIEKLKEHSQNLANLQEMVETTIDLDMVEQHEYMIKAAFDSDLEAVRNKMNECLRNMSKEHERVGKKLDMELDKKLKLEKSVQFGYCFRLTQKDAAVIRSRPKEFLELQVIKAGTYFATPTLRELSASFEEASREYEKQQAALVKEVVSIVATYCPVFEALNGLIAHMDVLISFAHVAVHSASSYVKPSVLPKGTGDLILKDARHPCLEVQDDVEFIPNDVAMLKGKSTFHIITGPNMGGKSTYIRQIGVIALMAQCGCYVPCSEATLPIFDCILARVGAGDQQLKGVSTFMAEMLETATILKSATENSLIVVDELGRGTSTYDGFGLAWAISEHVAREIRGFCLFATHFHELTALANEVPTMENFHVTAHVGSGESGSEKDITLLYKVQKGVCDQSFGIHVAELANFPESVVKLAKRKAAELEYFSEEGTGGGLGGPDSSRFAQDKVDEGAMLLEGFLAELKAIPNLDLATPEEAFRLVRVVHDRKRAALDANDYVREMLAEV